MKKSSFKAMVLLEIQKDLQLVKRCIEITEHLVYNYLTKRIDKKIN